MDPLVVLDLYSAADPAAAAAVVAAHHRHTSPERPLRIATPGDDLARAFRDAAGIQVTGSPLMLGEPPALEWAHRVGRALEAAAGRGTPVLGVCFGHQLLGTHFGASLRSWDGNRWGVAPVAFAGGGPWPSGDVDLVFTHRDHLVDAGEMEVAARGGLGGIQALAHPELPVWTVQGHPEADAALCVRAEGPRWSERYPAAAIDTPEAKAILARFGALLRRPAPVRR